MVALIPPSIELGSALHRQTVTLIGGRDQQVQASGRPVVAVLEHGLCGMQCRHAREIESYVATQAIDEPAVFLPVIQHLRRMPSTRGRFPVDRSRIGHHAVGMRKHAQHNPEHGPAR
ncbi:MULTISPECIES: hypothetical protein [Paraburkholderia]|uniref:Uncharacterized protein n=1 Tax=Paraburkholderia franconis TaxID=2654983 RepID=A0A7X1NGU0_9BURK|nr:MULTISPECIES: hypothetical protein [Paraburkholderia]MPW21725.1 hypothetical protein [Paraburkholderia franconis]